MRRSLVFKYAAGLSILLAALLLCQPAAAAPVFNQDPGGGGGGGGLCWTGSCAFCGQDCHDLFGDICWDTCEYIEMNGNCACYFENGCQVTGTCTYVP